MTSLDTKKARESRAFRASIADPALGKILEIHDFDPGPAIANVDRPVFVVSCYSDRSRQIGTIFEKVGRVIKSLN